MRFFALAFLASDVAKKHDAGFTVEHIVLGSRLNDAQRVTLEGSF
jgi:hypothetical protein